MVSKSDIYYYISLTGVIILVIWAILKSFGLIQSPAWMEMVPLFSIAIVFGGLIVNVKHIASDLKEVKRETKTEFHNLREKITCIDKDVEVLKDRQKR